MCFSPFSPDEQFVLCAGFGLGQLGIEGWSSLGLKIQDRIACGKTDE
jgi:hypothetical protein